MAKFKDGKLSLRALLPRPTTCLKHPTQIFQAMINAKATWEAGSGSGEDTGSVEPGPTHNEALQVAMILEKYMNGFDDPFMCKLESMLGTFESRTHVLEMQHMRGMIIFNANGLYCAQ